KQLARYQAANEYAVAWVIQQSLGGHAIPLDAETMRVLRRLGLIDDDTDDPEVIRTSLEHLIPKAKGSLFNELLSAVANEYCWKDEPSCSSCPLSCECPTAQDAQRETVSTERVGRPKPR